MIYVVDFGSQTAHLIARRIKSFGVATEIVLPDKILELASHSSSGKLNIKGIILSGGPSSVYIKNAPIIDPKVFSLGIPILGICYGLQLSAHLLGGKVVKGKKEYGPTHLKLDIGYLKFDITKDLSKSFVVWMSHGDEVISMPKDYEIIGSTGSVRYAFVQNLKKKFFGVQFHPEVEHTEGGLQILKNFLEYCHLESPLYKGEIKNQKSKIKITTQNSNPEFIIHNSYFNFKQKENILEEIEENIKRTVGDSCVIGAVSGGVDSTVAGVLAARAIGNRFIPIYVENGLMRDDARESVVKIFKKYGIKPIVVNAIGETLKKIQGISNPEKKRKIIGNLYIKIFEKEMQKLAKSKNIKFLMQGTIYSDVIESGASRHPDEQKDQGVKHASKIKSHHNVGGLPKKMKLKLLEPLREFYKDEVRKIGVELGLPDEFVWKQPFPGPGFAIRIRGEVTKKRLEQEKKADKIVMEELEKAGLLRSVFISFPVMTGTYSTAVKGDGKFFGEVVALRVVESKDVMTSKWAELPYGVLQKISSRIVNEVKGVSRVVYDITTKPPATMEWE